MSIGIKAIVLLVVLSPIAGCKDTGTYQDQSLNLRVTLVDCRLWADFRTPILPEDDNVLCQLTMVVRNTSQTIALEGAQISDVEVFSTNTTQRIGTVRLYTSWNGSLAAGAVDTVHLIKRTNQGPTLVPIPCDSTIMFRVALLRQGEVLGVVQRDSVLFECYY